MEKTDQKFYAFGDDAKSKKIADAMNRELFKNRMIKEVSEEMTESIMKGKRKKLDKFMEELQHELTDKVNKEFKKILWVIVPMAILGIGCIIGLLII